MIAICGKQGNRIKNGRKEDEVPLPTIKQKQSIWYR